METESASLTQSTVMTNGDFGLQQIHQLRPETSAAMSPFTVNHDAPAQMAANIPPAYSNNYGAMDGSKTLPTAVIFDTRKRYKRETNLKFTEGTL